MITELDYWQRLRMKKTESSPERFTHFYLDEIYIALRARGYKSRCMDSIEKHPSIKYSGLNAGRLLSIKPGSEKTFSPKLYPREVVMGLVDELSRDGKVSLRKDDTIEGILREVQAI